MSHTSSSCPVFWITASCFLVLLVAPPPYSSLDTLNKIDNKVKKPLLHPENFHMTGSVMPQGAHCPAKIKHPAISSTTAADKFIAVSNLNLETRIMNSN